MGSNAWPAAEHLRVGCSSLAIRVRILAEMIIRNVGVTDYAGAYFRAKRPM